MLKANEGRNRLDEVNRKQMLHILVRHCCWFFSGPTPNSSIFQSRSSISSDSGCWAWRCEYISSVVGLNNGCSGTVRRPNSLLRLKRKKEKRFGCRYRICKSGATYSQNKHILICRSSSSPGSVNIESASSERIRLACSSVRGKDNTPPCV